MPIYMTSSSSAEEIAFVSDVLKSNDAPSITHTINVTARGKGSGYARGVSVRNQMAEATTRRART